MKTEDVGATELMRACKEGDIIDVLSLLEAGKDVNESDGNNNTALMYAIVSDVANSATNPNYMLIIDKLLENNAELNVKNMQFETPLILAAKNNNTECLKKLLEAGADNVEVMDQTGNTIYTYAYKNDCNKVIDDFINNNMPAAEAPARRSFLTRALDVVLYPFRLIGKIIGSIFKSIAGAVVQLFINKSAKPRASVGTSVDNYDSDDDISEKIANPQTITRLTSKTSEPVKQGTTPKKKGWFDFSKEKKPATRFSASDIAKINRLRELGLRGVTPPGSPKESGSSSNNKQEI